MTVKVPLERAFMIPEQLVFVDLETTRLEPWRPVIRVTAVAVARNLAELDSFEAKIKFPVKLLLVRLRMARDIGYAGPAVSGVAAVAASSTA
jgi:hypothetical protein